MKKLAIIIASLMILGTVTVSAQEKPASKPVKKDTMQTKSKKAEPKKSEGSYHMNKSNQQSSGMNAEQNEDPSKIKSTGQPVYKK